MAELLKSKRSSGVLATANTETAATMVKCKRLINSLSDDHVAVYMFFWVNARYFSAVLLCRSIESKNENF